MSAVLVVLAAAIAMMVVESIAPGRRWPAVPGWLPRALLFNGFQVAAVFLAGAVWDVWFPKVRLWDLTTLGTVPGAVLGYFVITFVYYWWHRARHEVQFLWRWFHQIHHSPQRIEVITSFYKHPLEIVANSALSSFVLYALVGIGPEAGALAVTMTGLAELFYHWNVRTPHWLGYIIQRPESHRVHHRQGWHRSNFADLPLWDMIFGTLNNPRNDEGSCGFGHSLETKVGEMLFGRDIHADH